MKHHISDLSTLNVPIDGDIKNYVSKIESSAACSSSVNWLTLLKPKSMMDDHVLIGGLSELDFPYGYIISHPNTNEKIVTLAYSDVSDISSRVKELSDRYQWLLTRGSDSVILAPVCSTQEMHWGLVIVQRGAIWWADSFGYPPFGKRNRNVLHVMRDVLKVVQPLVEWKIQVKENGTYSNYMLEVLNYKNQSDAYSCGFYVLSTMCHFAEAIGDLHAFPYITCDAEVTEKFRGSAVRAYMKHVKMVYETKRIEARSMSEASGEPVRKVRVSDNDVMVYICQNRMRFFTNFDTPSSSQEAQERARARPSRLCKDESLYVFGIVREDADGYVEELKAGKEFFQKRKTVEVKDKAFSIRQLYSCFRFRRSCKATMTGRFYHEEKVWRFVKSHVHNHQPVVPTPVVPRSKN